MTTAGVRRVPRLLVVDTETGGLDASRHSLLSLAGVVWHDGEVGESLELLVNEGEMLSVTAEALAVNRITLDDIRDRGQAPAAVVTTLHAFLDRHFGASAARERIALVGHNVGFDIGFLRRLYAMAHADFDAVYSHRILDTAAIVRFLSLAGALPLTEAGATAVFEYFGIAPTTSERHTAKHDALATAKLLTHLIATVGATGRTSP